MNKPPSKIPAIKDLYENKQITQKNQELNILLNQQPKVEWVKTHPITKTKYIPIEIVEYLATNIFSKWWVDIKSTQLLANSIVVTVKVSVTDPITGEAMYQDGVGASPIQTDKGAGAVDFNSMKSVGVQLAAPSAESYAIKDAFEKFGKLFGKDLNRKDEMNYQGALENAVANLEFTYRAEIQAIDNIEDLQKYYNEHKGSGKEFEQCMFERNEELKAIKIG